MTTNNSILCPCCRNRINKFSIVLLNNLKENITHICVICINPIRSNNNLNAQIVSCPE